MQAAGSRELSPQSETRLGTAPLGRLMLSLAIPSMLAQLVNILYNIVDRIYIGHIPGEGALALTGLGVCGPILTLVAAFSFFVGSGGSPLAAIALGEGDRARAERILGAGAALLLLFSAVLTAGFLAFRRPLLRAFGASEATLPYADAYIVPYLTGTLFVQLALGLNPFIVCQGRSRTAMLSVLIGAVSNIALDPLFIFTFDMGVRGAALATVISQALSAAWVLAFLCSRRSGLRLRRAYLRFDGRILARVAALGVSPFIMAGTECLIATVFNVQLRRWGGDLYVGSMTVLHSVMQTFTITLQGFTGGVQPILSYNYGAGRYDRVTGCFRRMLCVTVSGATLGCLLALLFPGAAAAVFTDDAALIAIVERVLPVYMGSLWIFGVQMSVQASFLALGQAKRSFFIAVLRKVLLLTPLAFILPQFIGLMGIYWAEPVSDLCSAVTAGLLFLPVYRRLSRGERLD